MKRPGLGPDASLMLHRAREELVKTPFPEKPTLADFFALRLPDYVANHLLQSATRAMNNGEEERVVLACLLHDLGQAMFRTNHGYWGAALIEPYVDEEITLAVRYHQALRYYPDPEVGYQYPPNYLEWFGADPDLESFLVRDYEIAKNHSCYKMARAITLNDEYSFDPDAEVSFAPFEGIVARHFRQPPEGLGQDRTSASHMWRTLADPFKF